MILVMPPSDRRHGDSRRNEGKSECMHVENLVIGGGLAGTTVAVRLFQQGLDCLLIESAPRLGGKVETQITPEACFEFGPNSFSNQSPAIFDLLERLGLSGEILEAGPAARNRFILKDGKIVRLPKSPAEILTTPALSLEGRLRFLAEAIHVPKKKNGEESVRDFFTRHFGREVADYFADPFVSGIYAGDASRLSLREAFPTMAEAEARASSLIRYLLSRRKTADAVPKSYELKRGLESIFHRAREILGEERIRLGEAVLEIIPEGNGVRVVTDRGDYAAKTLYLTAPAYAAASLLKKRFPDISEILSKIEYAPVATFHLRVPVGENFPFDGFGILLPSLETRRILGAVWNSALFPSLFADREHHYLTVYAGGARNGSLVGAEETELKEIVCSEVQDLFALSEPPSFLQMRRHPRAIPQYTLGYGDLSKSLHDSLARHPFLKLAGNYMGGISMPKTVAYAAGIVQASS